MVEKQFSTFPSYTYHISPCEQQFLHIINQFLTFPSALFLTLVNSGPKFVFFLPVDLSLIQPTCILLL